jgi:lysophospholipase L1-like esterase
LLYALLLVAACDRSPKHPASGEANAVATSGREPPGPSAPPSASSRPELLTLDVERPPPPGEPKPRAQHGRRPYVVAVLGDSLSDPKVGGGGYLAYVQERCPKTRIDNFAKGGWMVNQMRRRFEEEVLADPVPGGVYSHLVVFGGVNDMYSDLTAGRTPPKIQGDLSRIYARARERGMKVVALTVAPWGGFTRYFTPHRGEATLTVNQWIFGEQRAGAIDVVVDAYALLSCGEPEKLCAEYEPPFRDGLHFGKVGQRKLGEALYEAAFKDCE